MAYTNYLPELVSDIMTLTPEEESINVMPLDVNKVVKENTVIGRLKRRFKRK